MGECKLISELGKLKRSSIYSVDNALVADPSNVYFHVTRQIENEMMELLRKVNRRGDKVLVLLCGSAGDGKSHLLSYLQCSNSDPASDNLLDGYEIYNDATESNAPRKTAIETLAERLVDFDDEHFSNNDGKKMILAINLGTLNNFISSEAGKRYLKLVKYVEDKSIISDFSPKSEYQNGSVFQHISFADYHMFSLSENGAGYEYVDALTKKIVNKYQENHYYAAYCECEKCPRHTLCPVRQNFEFMQNDINRDAIEYCLLKVEFKDKLIISTRDVLDFIYRVLVPPDCKSVFDKLDSTDQIDIAKTYIQSTTPMLLFDGDGVSELLSIIRKYDPLRIRNAKMDMEAIRIHSLNDIESEYKKITADTPYTTLAEIGNLQTVGLNPDVKQEFFNFFARLQVIRNNDLKKEDANDFEQYLKYIYFQNTGQEKKLAALYKMVISSVMRWNGITEDEYICIDNSNRKFCVLERLKLEGAPSKSNKQLFQPVVRYVPYVIIKLKNENQSDNSDVAKLDMDYSLFKLLLSMKDGYMPTAHDKNTHTDFDSYVCQLIKLGSKTKKVIIRDKKTNCDMSFSIDNFGEYEFKVVD
jgi:DNA phosphorothioation-dependent restriction protein DptF